jgi:hypothetical protein
MIKNLGIILAHHTPGRVRIRLSHSPGKDKDLIRIIEGHAGIRSVSYTRVSKSLVVTYDEREVAVEEIILRTSLALSKDYDFQPVRIVSKERTTQLNTLSALAALLLLLNHGFFLVASKAKMMNVLTTITGIATLAAVVDHVIQDIRQTGQLHPEVFSIYYLIASFPKGTVLKGSTITWMLTFARHILEKPSGALRVKTKKTDPTCHIRQCEYDVIVSRDELKGMGGLLRQIPQIALNAYREGKLNLEDRLIQQLQGVVDAHDAVIEGLDNLQQKMYLKVDA